MKHHAYFGIILILTKYVESLSKNYYKVRWNYYKLRQLSLLQSAMDCYYKLRQLFYDKVRRGLLQITTGITKGDDYYKLRQYIIPVAICNRPLPLSKKLLQSAMELLEFATA